MNELFSLGNSLSKNDSTTGNNDSVENNEPNAADNYKMIYNNVFLYNDGNVALRELVYSISNSVVRTFFM